MPTALRTPKRSALTLLGLLLAALLFPYSPANASGSITWDGFGPGYNDVYEGERAASWLFDVEGTAVSAYCIQFGVGFNQTSEYVTVSHNDSGVTNVNQAAWLAINSSDVGTELADTKLEHAAVQLAIWTVTDQIDVDKVRVAELRDRTRELVSAAGSRGPQPADFQIVASGGRTSGNQAEITATVTDDSGFAIVNATLAVAIGDQTMTMNTGDDGTATGMVDVTDDAGTVTVTYQGRIRSGTVITPAAGGQMLVLADTADVSRTAQVTIPAVEQPDSEPEPDPEPEPTETVTETVEVPAETQTEYVEVEVPAETQTEYVEVEVPAETQTEFIEVVREVPVVQPARQSNPAPAPAPAAAPVELPYTGTGVTAAMIPALLGMAGTGAWLRRRR